MSATVHPQWHTLSSAEVLTALGTSGRGLSRQEAAARLVRYGPNIIRRGGGVNPWAILFHQFASPLIYILLVALGVTLAIEHWVDSIVIGAVVVLNAVIGFTQEFRAENAMQALLALVSPRARVVRDGRDDEVDGKSLVPGDIVLLQSGALVPADLRLLVCTRLNVDESPLTGESLSVTKSPEPLDVSRSIPLGDRKNMAFMGTTVASGRGVGVVVATGGGTQVGSIARDLRRTTRAETPLQARMAQFGRLTGIAVLGASAAVFALGIALGEPLSHMFLVAVAVSAIPEGLPVAMTIVLAVGVHRMAKRNAIVRRLAAVETLGSCTVIVSDKTGTLTENQMTVQEIFAGGRRYVVTGAGRSLEGNVLVDGAPARVEADMPLYLTLQAGALTNEASLRVEDGGVLAHGDPTESALLVAAAKAGLSHDDLLLRYPRLAEVPFEPERQFSASVHMDGGRERVMVKGAPERVLEMCGTWMTPEGPRPLDRDAMATEAMRMAEQGFRVLAMAYGEGADAAALARAGAPEGLMFLGLQGMMDPPRQEAARAVAACKRAGIRVLMVTGDHAATAAVIARRLDIDGASGDVRTGAELEAMSDDGLAAVLRRVSVYARVSPVQKLRIVDLLRRQGHIVAVTGDGVNDAPALRSAHIGAAMGLSGTDVAKEASDIVLTDDNFATVYAAVEEGRTSFANIRKVTFLLVSVGVGELITILTGLALGLPLPYLPVQILWLNLVTNGIQDIALAFEPGEPEQGSKPPRDSNEGILSGFLGERLLLVGAVLTAGTLGIFVWELTHGATLAYAQVAALTTMVVFQNFHVGNCRSEEVSVFRKSIFSNRFLLLGVLGALAVHLGAMYFSPIRFLLGLEPLSLDSWVRLVVVASSVLVAVEVHKIARRPRARGERPRPS
ncbi:MAG: HAD-IC family P-type ATPase [Dehalococcoidia bacterium]|nr:HAD-IC family P-type ATPase [Dehalococcoidia bacterium]